MPGWFHFSQRCPISIAYLSFFLRFFDAALPLALFCESCMSLRTAAIFGVDALASAPPNEDSMVGFLTVNRRNVAGIGFLVGRDRTAPFASSLDFCFSDSL